MPDDQLQLIAQIRELSANQDLSNPDVAQVNPKLVRDSISEFGTWGNAVRAAGKPFTFDIKFQRVRVGRDKIPVLQKFLRWTREHGFADCGALSHQAPDLHKEVCDTFSTFSRAAERLGLPTVPQPSADSLAPARPMTTAQKAKPPAVEPKPTAPEPEKPKAAVPMLKSNVSALMLKRLVDKWVKEHGALSTSKLKETDAVLLATLIDRYGKLSVAAKAMNAPFEESEEEQPPEPKKPVEPTVTKEPQLITCEICGKQLRSLGAHLRTHNITADEYKKKYNVDSIVSSGAAVKKASGLITCKICGKQLRSLGAHLRTHNITADEYKKKYNVYSIVASDKN